MHKTDGYDDFYGIMMQNVRRRFLKRNMLILIVLLSTLFLHAEPQESYDFLSRVNRLEHRVILFTNNYLLKQKFQDSAKYKAKMQKAFKQYDIIMRQTAIDMKGADQHKLLTRFIDMKNRMNDLLSKPAAQEAGKDIVALSQQLEEEIERVSQARVMALSPRQRVLFSLMRMEVLLAELTQHYLLYASDNFSTPGPAPMQAMMKSFEQNIQICTEYPFWAAKEKAHGKRIEQTWKVLKKYLTKPGLDLIIELGSTHLEALLENLRMLHESNG
jgi:hypothetical protein